MSTIDSKPSHVRADFARIAITFGLIAVAGSAQALSTDRQQPLDIRANYQESVLGQKAGGDTNVATLKGNVEMVQGSLKANGDLAVVYDTDKNGKAGDGSIKRLTLTGKPAKMQQQLDNDGGLMTATANKIEYNTGSSVAEFTGDVVVIQQGKSEFRGDHMTYNTNTGAMKSGEESSDGKVRLRFLPQAKAGAK
ncbi:MAG: lipopolysaccharide transport periplasmic protein LptA [Dokdonella sp.]